MTLEDARSVFIRILIVLTIFSMFLCGVIYLGFGYPCLFDSTDAYFKVPANAVQVEQHLQHHSRSCTYVLRFKIPPAELDAFLATTYIDTTDPTLPAWDSIDYYVTLAEWDLSQAESYLVGTAYYQLNVQVIFIDTGNLQQYAVYLITTHNWI